MKICSNVQQIISTDTYFEITTNAAPIRIYFLTEDIVRVRVGFDGDFAEESYSLMMTGWEDRLDDLWGAKRTRITPIMPTMNNTANEIQLQSRSLDIKITKEPFALRIYDKEGTLLHADVPELAYQEDRNARRIHASAIAEGDHFYGFGEKTGSFNKSEQYMSMSPADSLGYNPKETDSLYKHIPFYL